MVPHLFYLVRVDIEEFKEGMLKVESFLGP